MKKFDELPEGIKKNILDLHYNKNLQYFNTTIIIIFTYFIGLIIALLTKQINLFDNGQLYLLALISIVVLSILSILLLYFKGNMKKIITEISKLNI